MNARTCNLDAGEEEFRMAKSSAKAIIERDLNRVSQARSEKDVERAVDHITRVINSDVSLVSIAKIRTALAEGSLSKYFEENLYLRLLG